MKIAVLSLMLMCGYLWPFTVAGNEAEGEILPDIVLTVPENPKYQEYLGLKGKAGTSFSIQDIQADMLLIELFDMYCLYCQQEAPEINELYEKMQGLPKKGPVVKIIGLGAANSQFEVEHFRDTYEIAFPLFPDKDMSHYKALSGKGTPGFIGCRLQAGERPIIVLRKSGGFSDSSEFLQELLQKGRLGKEEKR